MSERLPIVPGCMAVIIGTCNPEASEVIGKTVEVIRKRISGPHTEEGWLVAGDGLIRIWRTEGGKHFIRASECYIAERHLMRIDGFNPFSVPSETLKEITHVDY